MDKFLIVRLSSLGDIIHTLPAFSALRQSFPEATISWLVEDSGKEILDFVPGLDRTIVLYSKKWSMASKNFWRELFRVIKEIREKDQFALDFQGLVKSGLFVFLSGAKTRIGFHKKNLREPSASIFYTEHLDPITEKQHVISKNLSLLKRVGIKNDSFDFPIQVPEALSESVMDKITRLNFDEDKHLVILNVGAAWETKRWFAERWIELIRHLKERKTKLFFLLLWGTDTERILAEEIHAKTDVAVAPRLSLKEVIALIQKSDLLISGDTFAIQVACAFSRPVVGIFGPTTPNRNGPFSDHDKVVFHELECSHCYKRSCSSLECLKKITAQEVAELSLQRLGDHD